MRFRPAAISTASGRAQQAEAPSFTTSQTTASSSSAGGDRSSVPYEELVGVGVTVRPKTSKPKKSNDKTTPNDGKLKKKREGARRRRSDSFSLSPLRSGGGHHARHRRRTSFAGSSPPPPAFPMVPVQPHPHNQHSNHPQSLLPPSAVPVPFGSPATSGTRARSAFSVLSPNTRQRVDGSTPGNTPSSSGAKKPARRRLFHVHVDDGGTDIGRSLPPPNAAPAETIVADNGGTKTNVEIDGNHGATVKSSSPPRARPCDPNVSDVRPMSQSNGARMEIEATGAVLSEKVGEVRSTLELRGGEKTTDEERFPSPKALGGEAEEPQPRTHDGEETATVDPNKNRYTIGRGDPVSSCESMKQTQPPSLPVPSTTERQPAEGEAPPVVDIRTVLPSDYKFFSHPTPDEMDRANEDDEILEDDDQTESMERPPPPAIPIPPPPGILRSLHDQATAHADTHQYHLTNESGTGLLSLEDVIIPAVCHVENEALRAYQREAQRAAAIRYEISYGTGRVGGPLPVGDDGGICSRDEYVEADPNVVILKECRRAVKRAGITAALAARRSRLDREEEARERVRLEEERKRVEREELRQRREEQRRERRELRAREREVRRERQLAERKKNLPRNKETWREVAILMTALAKMEREEREWKAVEETLDRREAELAAMKENPELIAERVRELQIDIGRGDEVPSKEADNGSSNGSAMDVPDIEEAVKHAVEDITLSTDRINHTLRGVIELMDETEIARKDLYDKYAREHQFRGYTDKQDPKALIRSLANG